MVEPLKIGLLGFGNIGSGVILAMRDNKDLLDARCPRPLELRWVCDVDLDRPRPVEVDRSLLTTDAKAVIADPEVDVIVELIGGLEPARTLVESALRADKHVVTANKAMLAQHGAELLALAAEKGVRLLFEASVGGGIPVIRVLTECLAANRITRIEGILNGTCNYILTQMNVEKISFQEALAKAQNLGYAEPDPTADIESMDAANKIAVLASLAFEYDIRYQDVDREGITQVTLQDLRAAEAAGYVIKQRAVAERSKTGEIAVSVRPSLLSQSHPLAAVNGVLNAVGIGGEPVGEILLIGPGAGPQPTASAVLSDLMAISTLEPGHSPPPPLLRIPTRDKLIEFTEPSSNGYWLRVLTRGNLEAGAEIAQILANHEVAVRSITMHDGEADDSAAVVEVFVAEAAGPALRNAVSEIDGAGWRARNRIPLVLPVLE